MMSRPLLRMGGWGHYPVARRWLLVSMALHASCSSGPVGVSSVPEVQVATVPISVASAPALATLVITVSAPDLVTSTVVNVTLSEGQAADTVTVPAGLARTIRVEGFDGFGLLTHVGEIVADLVPGLNDVQSITLRPLLGQLPIMVILGSYTVGVTPEVDSIRVGETLRLTGVVVSALGDTLAVPLRWSSSNPGWASVDSIGVVAGRVPGQVTVMCLYGAANAAATVHVLP